MKNLAVHAWSMNGLYRGLRQAIRSRSSFPFYFNKAIYVYVFFLLRVPLTFQLTEKKWAMCVSF